MNSEEMLALAKLPEDVCECGDWRSAHPNDGPCVFNEPGFDLCHGGRDCMSFRRARSPEQLKGEGR